jgi:carboxymethylenebutenolidase
MPTPIEISASTPAGPLSGALAEPSGAAALGGVVVIQEFWGLSEYIKSVCDRLALAGLRALAPDLFHGKVAADKAQAAGLMKNLDPATAQAEIAASVAYLGAAAPPGGRVAVLGFCMGGGLALDAARGLPTLGAAVCFYGVPRAAPRDFAGVRVPILAHFASRDEWAKTSIAEEIRGQVVAGGGRMEVYEYDAGHAFMRTTDPAAYSQQPAELAWERTLNFLKKHLSAA